MTVKELSASIQHYLADYGSEDDDVIIVDDWTPAKYFDVDFATGSVVSRPSPAAPNYKSEKALCIITDLVSNEIK